MPKKRYNYHTVLVSQSLIILPKRSTFDDGVHLNYLRSLSQQVWKEETDFAVKVFAFTQAHSEKICNRDSSDQ